MESFGPQNSEIFYWCAEASNEAIMITDSNGIIRWVNRAFESIYLYPRAEVLGKTPRILRSGVHAPAFYEQMWTEILDPEKKMWRGNVVNRAKDRTEVPVLLSISSFTRDGETAGYMSIALDMRAQKKMEAQILHQDRLASIGLLASGLAHEIGTPLGVIRGRAEYLLMQAREEDRRGLETIVNQIDRISKLIYALLHVAKSGKSEMVVPVRLSPVLAEIEVLLEPLILQNNIHLRNEILEDVVVLADPDRLEQLFLNLILNSVHAIEVAQKTEGSSRASRQRAIHLTALKNGSSWEISVRDEGGGISQDNLKKIFQPFFTTKEVGTGTGLGLVMCQHILVSWGGDISLTSRQGEGTTVRATIPSAGRG